MLLLAVSLSASTTLSVNTHISHVLCNKVSPVPFEAMVPQWASAQDMLAYTHTLLQTYCVIHSLWVVVQPGLTTYVIATECSMYNCKTVAYMHMTMACLLRCSVSLVR